MSNMSKLNNASIFLGLFLTIPYISPPPVSPSKNEYPKKASFEIEKGERLIEAERVEGSTPLITASAVNNGITSFIDYDTFSSKKKIFLVIFVQYFMILKN